MEHPQLETWRVEHLQLCLCTEQNLRHRLFENVYLDIFSYKSQQKGCISGEPSDQCCICNKSAYPNTPSATPILPSNNHNTLRFIPSSYWTILYDVMLPKLKRRFLFTCILDLRSRRRRRPKSVVGALMSDGSVARVGSFKPKVSAK